MMVVRRHARAVGGPSGLSAHPRWLRMEQLRRRSAGLLPMNSDVEVARTIVGVPVMVRIRPEYLVLAVVGGAVGSGTRFMLTQLASTWRTLSVGTTAVNVIGPYLLGMLIGLLAHGAETRRRRALRLLVGVGFLGALTSYAQLAVDVVVAAERQHVLLAGIYALATVTAGAGAVWLGLLTASRWHRVWGARWRRRWATLRRRGRRALRGDGWVA